MYRVAAKSQFSAVGGHVDLSFRQTAGWYPYLDGTSLVLFFGDGDAGPLVFLSSSPPADTMAEPSFAHSHASDTWRISVLGTTNMGRDAYMTGQFRFQDGGVPYAADNAAWGPDGGFGLVMFADRRGFAMKPVQAKIAETVVPEQRRMGEAFGLRMLDPSPGAPAIATTLGATVRGHLDGGFDSADRWDELVPGIRAAVAVFGDPDCGPVLLLARANAGATVLPAGSFGTEVLHVVVSGSALIGDGVLDTGDLRLQEAQAPGSGVVAGPNGLSHVVVIGDRRALTAFQPVDLAAAEPWRARTGELLSSLTSMLNAAV